MTIKDLWDKVLPKLKKKDVGKPIITSTPEGMDNCFIKSKTYKRYTKPTQEYIDYWSSSSHSTYRRFVVPIGYSNNNKTRIKHSKHFRLPYDDTNTPFEIMKPESDYYDKLYPRGTIKGIDYNIPSPSKKQDPKDRDYEDFNYEQWNE